MNILEDGAEGSLGAPSPPSCGLYFESTPLGVLPGCTFGRSSERHRVAQRRSSVLRTEAESATAIATADMNVRLVPGHTRTMPPSAMMTCPVM
jgi:hypothetical protein